MFTYISSWLYNPAQDLPEQSEEQKQNRYKLLKEIQTFDNSNLSPIPETIENFIQQPKKKYLLSNANANANAKNQTIKFYKSLYYLSIS